MPVRLIDPAQSGQRAGSGTSYRSSTRGGDRRRAFGPYARPRLSAWPLRIWLQRFPKRRRLAEPRPPCFVQLPFQVIDPMSESLGLSRTTLTGASVPRKPNASVTRCDVRATNCSDRRSATSTIPARASYARIHRTVQDPLNLINYYCIYESYFFAYRKISSMSAGFAIVAAAANN